MHDSYFRKSSHKISNFVQDKKQLLRDSRIRIALVNGIVGVRFKDQFEKNVSASFLLYVHFPLNSQYLSFVYLHLLQWK